MSLVGTQGYIPHGCVKCLKYSQKLKLIYSHYKRLQIPFVVRGSNLHNPFLAIQF